MAILKTQGLQTTMQLTPHQLLRKRNLTFPPSNLIISPTLPFFLIIHYRSPSPCRAFPPFPSPNPRRLPSRHHLTPFLLPSTTIHDPPNTVTSLHPQLSIVLLKPLIRRTKPQCPILLRDIRRCTARE